MAVLPSEIGGSAPRTDTLSHLIDESVVAGRQSVSCQQIWAVNATTKLRLSIKSDSYDFQSYAKADLWNATSGQWNPVYQIHYSQMKTPAKLFYWPERAGVHRKHFLADLDQLKKLALQIIS